MVNDSNFGRKRQQEKGEPDVVFDVKDVKSDQTIQINLSVKMVSKNAAKVVESLKELKSNHSDRKKYKNILLSWYDDPNISNKITDVSNLSSKLY
jgi:hypothetical protein